MFNRLILVAACAVVLVTGCRSKKASNVPIPTPEQEALASFIKISKCEPTTCDAISCRRVSEGKTDNLPSYLVQCRWTDTRTAGSGTPKRCAFIHYSVEAGKRGIGNMFISEPSFGDGCVPDKEFVEQIKKAQGYSGDMP
jgi:hypothetical protein